MMSAMLKSMLACGNTTSCSTVGTHAVFEPHLQNNDINRRNSSLISFSPIVRCVSQSAKLTYCCVISTVVDGTLCCCLTEHFIVHVNDDSV